MEDKIPLTSAEKKRRFRNKMKDNGYCEIGVWIDPKHKKTVRDFVETLSKPASKTNPNQGSLFKDSPQD